MAPEAVPVAATVDALVRSSQPVAQQKGLAFTRRSTRARRAASRRTRSGWARFCKNLLSNALKFTERGEVSLRVFRGTVARSSFTVRDTGVGIPPHQQA